MNKTMKMLPLVAVMLLSGCVNLAPDAQQPQAPVEAAWPTGEAYSGFDVRKEALPSWQEFYQDERLRTVIAMALKNNRDLRIAALKVEKARAQYGIQRSQLLPTVGVNFQENVSRKQTANVDVTNHSYDASVGLVSYEVDFFGHVRNMNEQALQAYLATDDARASFENTLISEVAMLWLTAATDNVQLALQREILETQEESFRMIEESYRLGAASRLDYEQARTTVSAARAGITKYVRAVAMDRNALDLLCGAKVAEDLIPTDLPAVLTQKTYLPEGLPGDVILNRPDIRMAERSLEAAAANIGVARAAFLPRVTIMGGAGTSVGSGVAMTGQDGHLSDLFDPMTGYWNFVPKVSLPIFTGGRNIANLEAAKVSERIAVAEYEKAIQGAFREVADALATEGTVERELKALTDLSEAASKAYELADLSYKAGAVSYNDLLVSQRAMVDARQGMISAQRARVASAVTLYKVLGGGSAAAEKTE